MSSQNRPGPTWADPSRWIVDHEDGVHSIDIIRDGTKLTLVSASAKELARTIDRIVVLSQALSDDPTEPETPPSGALDPVLAESVQALQDVLEGHDALDVLSLVAMYLMPADMAMWREADSTLEQTIAAAEIIALALLGMGLPRTLDPPVQTASIIEEATRRAGVIIRLAQAFSWNRLAERAAGGPADLSLGYLSWRLAAHETAVRGRQYDSVARRLNTAILDNPRAEESWKLVLGYTYNDVLGVRDAVARICTHRMRNVAETMREATATDDPSRLDETVRSAFDTFFERPSPLRLVTIEDVRRESAIEPAPIQAILDRFSLGPDGRDARALISEFVQGRSPMMGKGIIQVPGSGYLILNGAIALDEIRRTCEAQIKPSSHWTKYSDMRASNAEKYVADVLDELLLERAAVRTSLKYRIPSPESPRVDLSATARTPNEGDIAEADVLLVLDGVAICVEVKSGDLRPKSRQGGPSQLQGDLEKNVTQAAQQADRLRHLVETNRGLWLSTGSWLDLSKVQEIHSIVVSLDDLGPVVLDMEHVIASRVIDQVHLPWITSLHDLVVICETLHEKPEDLLLYLRRRTHRESARRISASDELDVFMWFMSGGLYFEPDPVRLHTEQPGSRPPSEKERRRYEEQGRVVVGTFTDRLDAWYYWREGSSSRPIDNPTRHTQPEIAQITDHLKLADAPGWWRTAADINSYGPAALKAIAGHIREANSRTKQDGKFHSYTMGGGDDTGRWVLIFGTGHDTPRTREHLDKYLAAKKHSEWADRALAVLLNRAGAPVYSRWLSYPRQDDPELDRLARTMRLVPPDRAPRAIPPSAKQQAKRKRKKKRSR